MTGETAEGRGESRVEFSLLKIRTHSFLCIFINTENTSFFAPSLQNSLQVSSSALDAEPAAREGTASYAFSRKDRHKSELLCLGDRGKSAAAELVHARHS